MLVTHVIRVTCYTTQGIFLFAQLFASYKKTFEAVFRFMHTFRGNSCIFLLLYVCLLKKLHFFFFYRFVVAPICVLIYLISYSSGKSGLFEWERK